MKIHKLKYTHPKIISLYNTSTGICNSGSNATSGEASLICSMGNSAFGVGSGCLGGNDADESSTCCFGNGDNKEFNTACNDGDSATNTSYSPGDCYAGNSTD